MRILITGSEGLVGERLRRRCEDLRFDTIGVDIVASDTAPAADIRSPDDWAQSMGKIDGIVHLAAISRVAWGESDPEACRDINERGTQAIVDLAVSAPNKPWLIFASSREVYGDPQSKLVGEDDPLGPVNVYGKSKLAGEVIVGAARDAGLQTSILRLSNVYGGPRDHADRAVPALVGRAVANLPITLTGSDHYFDFVHVDDVVAGLLTVIERLRGGDRDLPPIHLATGVATSLGDLARGAIAAAGSISAITDSGARSFDVAGFCGDPDRADRLLGWRATVPLDQGLARLVEDIRRNGPPATVEMPR